MSNQKRLVLCLFVMLSMHLVQSMRRTSGESIEGVEMDSQDQIAVDMGFNQTSEMEYSLECSDIPLCSLCNARAGDGCHWTDTGCTKKQSLTNLGGLLGSASVSCRANPPLEATQPEGDAAAWFLSEEEVRGARMGYDRDHISAWTENNKVEFLQTGSDVFNRVSSDFSKAVDGDFVYISSWDLSPDIPLKPGQKTLEEIIKDMMSRGVRVRSLVYKNPTIDGSKHVLQLEERLKEHAKTCTDNAKKSLQLVDWRVDMPTGSVHQKTTIVQSNGKLLTTIGGVDLARDRWDTAAHSDGPERQPFKRDWMAGWIDRHVAVEGPASADIGNTFVERWNSDVKLTEQMSDSFSNEPYHSPDAGRGTVDVQLLRTYASSIRIAGIGALAPSATTQPFAPMGEVTYLHAYIKAVSKASHHIYIEDQYGLWQWELMAALGQALEGGVKYLTVVYAKASAVDKAGCMANRHKMLQTLKNAFPERVNLFVRRDSTFVHSKLWLVDDTWMAIGSANINYRSFTYDAEVGVAMVDKNKVLTPDGIHASALVFDARVKCIAELSGRTDAQVREANYEQHLAFLRDDSPVEEWTEIPTEWKSGQVFANSVTCALADPEGRSSQMIASSKQFTQQFCPSCK